MAGWGNVFGWIFDRFQDRRESLRNQEEDLKRKMNEILKLPSTSVRRYDYEQLADKLRKIQQELKNK